MTAESRRIQVLVVSPDLSVLHEIAWMLDAVGYDVQTSTDFDPAALWRRYSQADVVIVDGRQLTEPTREVFGHESDRPCYRVFLYSADKSTDFSAWYTAGAHDGLRTPVSRGELLSRVRAAARYVEFERRLQERSAFTQFSSMYSRRGFVRKLQRIASSDDVRSTQHAVLAVSVDWFTGIRRKSGEVVAQKLVSKAARAIRRVAGENAVSSYLGNGVFTTLLVGQSISAAKSVAESLVKEFGTRESLPESIPGPTLTSALMSWTFEGTAEQLLDTAQEMLTLGSQSGGDRTVVEGEFSKELAAWQEEMSVGSPFANVVAQDIMEPFPVILNRDDESVAQFGTTRHSCTPLCALTDAEGHFAGVAKGNEVASGEGLAESAARTSSETIDCNASFPEIYEAFTSRGCAELIITANDRPLGYITCDSFLTMIDPIDSESFAPVEPSVEELRFLVVPSLTIAEPEACSTNVV